MQKITDEAMMGPTPEGSARSERKLCGWHRLWLCQCQLGQGLSAAAGKWEEKALEEEEEEEEKTATEVHLSV